MAQSFWLSQRAVKLQQIACFHDETDSPERDRQVALYLRYQTTHDRGFHKSLNDLLKLRAEMRKREIGFESQQLKQSRARQQADVLAARAHQQAEEHARKQEAEKRRQELHKWKVLLAEAKVDRVLLRNANRQTPEHRIPAGSEPTIATQNAA